MSANTARFRARSRAPALAGRFAGLWAGLGAWAGLALGAAALAPAPAFAQPTDTRWVDPGTLRFSGGPIDKGPANEARAELAGGWAGRPVDVVVTPAGLVALQDVRVAVALERGLASIEVRVHQPGDPLPRGVGGFGQARTWGEALRHATQRGRAPPDGTTSRPRLPPDPLRPQPIPGDLGGEVREVNPRTLRFSQRSAGGNGRGPLLIESLRTHGWSGPPVDVIATPSGLVSIDNTRVAIAAWLGLERVPVRIHQPGDLLPAEWQGWRFGRDARTWGEALAHRTAASGLPPDGAAERPRVPGIPEGPAGAGQPSTGQPNTGQPNTGQPGELVRWVDPRTLRFSQRSAGGNGRAGPLRASMGAHGWAGEPVDVVASPRGLVTIDNTRVAVAQELGLERIPVRVHAPTDALPADMQGRFGPARTWGEALVHRTASQRPGLPPDGTAERPRMPAPEVATTARPIPEGSGFASVRPGAPGAFEPSRVSYALVDGVFAAVRAGALERAAERAHEAVTEADRAAIERGGVALRGARLEVVETNALLAEATSDGRVRVSTGLLNELDRRAGARTGAERARFTSQVLGLILAHEAAHVAGVRAERLADVEAVRALEASRLGAPESLALREAVLAFERPTGASRVDAFLGRVRDLLRHGTATSRIAALEAAARGEADPLARYRRADGTLEWQRLGRDRALREVGGLAHFGLALFLKELAVVARTGDRARIEEFFDGLLTTDFYKHYGLFVLGARAGEVAYGRYLAGYVKPRFVSGILKTNLVLATGLALPQLVEGTFDGRAFAISLGSLGLSSAAVKSGVAALRWVHELPRAAGAAGATARVGAAATRLARLGGWFYTAAELAVVLYLAEEVDARVHAWLDDRAARAALAEAGRELTRAAGDPRATSDEVRAAALAYHETSARYRDFLYRDLHLAEAQLAERLSRAAERAKKLADERAAALERLRGQPALLRSLEARYGSLEAYVSARAAEDEAAVTRDVDLALASYEREREARLRAVYEEGRRGRPLLGGLEHADWLARGARPGDAGDPWGARTDLFAGWGRDRAGAALERALAASTRNRLEAYDDEAEVLAAVARALRDRPEAARAVDDVRAVALRTRDLDVRLYRGDGPLDLGAPADHARDRRRPADDAHDRDRPADGARDRRRPAEGPLGRDRPADDAFVRPQQVDDARGRGRPGTGCARRWPARRLHRVMARRGTRVASSRSGDARGPSSHGRDDLRAPGRGPGRCRVRLRAAGGPARARDAARPQRRRGRALGARPRGAAPGRARGRSAPPVRARRGGPHAGAGGRAGALAGAGARGPGGARPRCARAARGGRRPRAG